MIEETSQSFPPANPIGLINGYIESELEGAGINLQRISAEGNVITVTTDKKVPEEIMSGIRQLAASYGFTVK